MLCHVQEHTWRTVVILLTGALGSIFLYIIKCINLASGFHTGIICKSVCQNETTLVSDSDYTMITIPCICSITSLYWLPQSLDIIITMLYPRCRPQPLWRAAANWHLFVLFPSNIEDIFIQIFELHSDLMTVKSATLKYISL